jgi:hypothetical protein
VQAQQQAAPNSRVRLQQDGVQARALLLAQVLRPMRERPPSVVQLTYWQ